MNIQQIIELHQHRGREAASKAFAHYINDHNLTTKQAIEIGNQIKQAVQPKQPHKTY